MIDLLEKNKEMLDKGLYNVADKRQLSRIAGLKNPNDYDLYLIVCALCNYDLPEKLELYDIRMQYYLKIKDVDPEQFAHKDSDYTRVDCGIHCRNTGAINKYGHYIFAINSKDKQLINDLWAHHSKDCLKYVDDKSDPEDTLISVTRDQFPSFLQMLDKMNIYYTKKNMEKNLVYSNNARNTLIDVNQLDLPDWMTPKDFQIEDAQYILKHKRMLLGHQMGCVSGNSRVRIKEDGKELTRKTTVANLMKLLEANPNIQIKCLVNGRFAFIPIKQVLTQGVQPTVKIYTENEAIECTLDHPIYTKNGWVNAMDLKIDDEIFTNGKKRKCLNCGATDDLIMHQEAQFFGYCRHCSYLLRGNRWKSENKLVKHLDKNGYVRLFGGLTKTMPNYERLNGQGGIYEHHQVWYEHTGHVVDTTKEAIHHINGDKADNRFENLELLTLSEHAKRHSDVNTTRLPQNSLDCVMRNGKMVYYVPKLEKIIKIEQGNTQLVYDIVLDSDDIHNFVCNNIVVHNCGKSLISILIGESLNMPKLVICPESLRLDWYQKIEQANNSADIQVQMSNQAPHFGKDWTIIGYKTVSKFLPNLKRYFKCIFVDECQWCKSVNNWGKPDSKRAEAVIDLAQSVEYCYLLSGTPIPSKNKDLFNILKMLRCESFDFNNQWAFKNYGDKFCDPKDNGFGMNYDGNSNSEELHQLIKPLMVRRLRKDVFPDLTKMRKFVPIEPHFKKDYKQVEYLLRHPERDIFGKIEPTSTAMALSMTGRKLLSSYKIDAAIELAESRIRAEESVVIVTCFNETANMLKAHFKDNACEIRGGMTDKAKELAKADFQNKNKAVCILNLQAGQVGLTLTAAHVMIVIDYFWNPTDMEQVEDRICRMGQNEDCLIYYIYCTNSTLDNIFVETLTDKSYNIDKVVDNKDQGEYNLRIERDKSAMQKLEELARATC